MLNIILTEGFEFGSFLSKKTQFTQLYGLNLAVSSTRPTPYSSKAEVYSGIIYALLARAKLAGGITRTDVFQIDVICEEGTEAVEVWLSRPDLESITSQTASSLAITSNISSIVFNKGAL